MRENDAYNILGLIPPCSQEEIKSAYKKKALQYHPDKNPTSGSHELFINISEAYTVLQNVTYTHKSKTSFFTNKDPYLLFQSMFPFIKKTFIQTCTFISEHGLTVDTMKYFFEYYSHYTFISKSYLDFLYIKKKCIVNIEDSYHNILVKQEIEVPFLDEHNKICYCELEMHINTVTNKVLIIPKQIVELPIYIKNIEYLIEY